MANSELEKLRDDLRRFAAERDWEQFHTPKNLAMAIGSEAGELLDVLRWSTGGMEDLSADDRSRATKEMADILIFLVRMADVLDVDLIGAVNEKLGDNAKRYPIDEVKGSAKKRP
jgi:NTP pyrophosphatase (non-canonical NTP hydrolase)